MSLLAQQQDAFLRALFDGSAHDATSSIAIHAVGAGARGLKVYQTNGHMLAERALLAAYPVVAQLLGKESFAELARALWHAHPPTCGDVGRWGMNLADFVRDDEQLRSEPYLADVALAEWALHRCATAYDVLPDPTSFALLTEHDPAHLYLRLAAGFAVAQSAWPVASLLSAHLQSHPSFQVLAQALQAPIAEDLVIWREHFKPRFRLAQQGEFDLLSAVLQGKSLAAALDASPLLDFASWFPLAVSNALVVGVTTCPVPSGDCIN